METVLAEEFIERFTNELKETRDKLRVAYSVINTTDAEVVKLVFNQKDLSVLLFAIEGLLDDEED